jgi:hypothetical protein
MPDNEHFEDFEFFEVTDEERANWLNILIDEARREKVLTYTPEALKRIRNIIDFIRTLMRDDDCEYTINLEKCDIFQQSLYINVDVVDFGTSPKNFWLFQDIIKKTDSIEIKWLPTGKTRISFYLNFVFKEIK